MRMNLAVVGTLIAVSAAADPDFTDSFTTLGPEISISPDPIAFGEQAVPLTSRLTFYVNNAGRADLEYSLALQGEGADVFELLATEGTLEPSGSQPVVLLFEPTTFLEYEATMVVTSNDETDPTLEIPITGTGVPAPLPDISVSSQSLDFGTVAAGATNVLVVELRNDGSADLDLGTVTQAGSGAFSMVVNPSDTRIAPGDTFALVLQYDPDSEAGDSSTLLIPSNDPDESEVAIVLLGNGGADYGYPEAVIDCPGMTNPPSVVRLDGGDSTDPEGFEPLEYEWTLVSVPTDPASSTPISDARITNEIGPYTDLETDAVGLYVVQLVVTNQLGTRSAPALCTVGAIPAEDLLVELTWDTSNADLDLHLALAGNDLFESPGDANFCNRNADWGAQGGLDDPSLNIDDRAGFGPENFAIDTPSDDMFDVRVHYFEDHGDDFVTATVRVYVFGELDPQFPQSRVMQRNETWDVARVNWDDSPTVGLLGSDLYEPLRRTCFNP
jgi:hypothetical protein